MLYIADSRFQNEICRRISKEDSLIGDILMILQGDGEQENQRLWCRAVSTCEPVISGIVEDGVELHI
ncbi:hypothetical protein RYX36_018327 [Vicia faba]